MPNLIHTLNHLLVNGALLFTAVTLFSFACHRFGHRTRTALGFGFGGVALLLLMNPFSVNGVLLDLRVVPLLLAFRFGGRGVGFGATLLFWSIRLFLMDGYPLSPFDLPPISLLAFVIPARGLRIERRLTLAVVAHLLLFVHEPFAMQRLPIGLLYAVAFLLATFGAEHCWLWVQQQFARLDAERLLARTDTLTGVANRLKIDETLSSLNDSASEYGVILVDIDRFKQVNDTYGHDVGDDVLRSLGALLTRESGPEALVGRLGGEEFLVILPNTPRIDMSQTAERLRHIVSRHDFSTTAGSVRVTISLGACHSNAVVREIMLRHADEALYVAKQSGRNRAVVSGESA